MRKTKLLILTGVVLSLSVLCLAFARADDDSEGLQLKATVESDGGSGIGGTAVVSIGEDGLRGKLKADNLKVGHAYTVWLFLRGGHQCGRSRTIRFYCGRGR